MALTQKQQEAIEAMERYGGVTKAARALGISHTAVRKRLRSVPNLVEDCSPAESVAPASGGFNLAGRTLLATKPTDVWKARFHALKPGMGYMIDHLADQWGNSADTVRNKAKRFGALRYAEDTRCPGNYIACIVHPDTPKGK